MRKLLILAILAILCSCVSTGDSQEIELEDAIQNASSEINNAPPAESNSQTIIIQPAASVAYKIGDTGPAGGLIFFDKGNNSGGWRYLEAAPVEAEVHAQWSVLGFSGTDVNNTQAGIGYGRRNTQLIIEKFRQTSGERDTAAQKADELVFKGFDDWFLPSQIELDQMYRNLRRSNLGNFGNEWYWSSTQTSSGKASAQNFSNGEIGNFPKARNPNNGRAYDFFVRSIRQVPGA